MSGTTPGVAISPDGRHIAFFADARRTAFTVGALLDSFTARPLAGTEVSGSPSPPFGLRIVGSLASSAAVS